MKKIRKDMASYRAHNSHYVWRDTPEFTRKLITELYPDEWLAGSRLAIALNKFTNRDTHIDIGSGTGWLVEKTSPFFKRVIGVEPSTAAVSTAKEINKANINVTFINKDMVDAFADLPTEQPAFYTSFCVFSHIKDYYVADFLELLSKVADGSTLYFDENYDYNVRRPRWYIRNQEWWRENLPDWELTFLEENNDGYVNGVYGVKVGRKNVAPHPQLSIAKRIQWFLQGIANAFIKATNRTGTKFKIIRFNR